MNLKGTKTSENLLKSFAGESQARMRYTYYASVAKKEGYIQISNILMEIADQEKEHAKRFYKFLKDEFKDEAIEITAAYPVSFHNETLKNLKAAASGENEEWSMLYPNFAKVAREEGFTAIANAFERIAEVEKNHEKRYNKLIANLEKQTVFAKTEEVLWMCTNCGYIYEGKEAPLSCPACLHPQGYFKVYKED